MTQGEKVDTKRARSELREQIVGLEAELERVMEDRMTAEAAVASSRERTNELLAVSSDIGEKEGNFFAKRLQIYGRP